MVSVCLFVCPSRSLLRRIKSVWKTGGIVRTVSAMACYIPSFKKFHARVHAISRNFHAIFTQFGLFQPFLGQFQHVGYQKAYTRAEKFIGGIGRGHRPQEGAKGPKEEAKGLQTGPKAP